MTWGLFALYNLGKKNRAGTFALEAAKLATGVEIEK